MGSFSISISVILLFANLVESKQPIQNAEALVQELFDKTASEQVKVDVPLSEFQEMRQKGVYASNIKMNFFGRPELAVIRRMLNIFDNNMFVTAWVTSALLEAYKTGKAPRPTDGQLDMALDFIHQFGDKNKPYNTSIKAFWQQRYNSTLKYYSSVPVNVFHAFKLLDRLPLDFIDKVLDDVGFKDTADVLKLIQDSKNLYLHAFKVPPDFDDTFVNIGLGALLSSMKDEFPDACSKWKYQNNNITSALDALKKYAYRPFSSDANKNVIDPKTYFYLRGFLDKAKNAGQDIALVPSWVQSIQELRKEYYLGLFLPFNVNNVGASVSANTAYGITSAVLNGLLPSTIFEDAEIVQIYLNTSSLIAYELNTNMSSRPDLALTYYASKMQFDWFVSRTVAELETARQKGPLPSPVMEQVYQILKHAAEGNMTAWLLANGNTDESGLVYYDNFLGNADMTLNNKTLNRAEDRIFTTAMSANALLYTWTVFSEVTGRSSWKPGVPDSVKTRILATVKWLTAHTLDGNYDPWNACFSTSLKSSTAFPVYYPANLFQCLNGTDIKDWSKLPESCPYRLGVQGHIEKSKYDAMIDQPRFYGMRTPVDFHGYNSRSSHGVSLFVIWSSSAYTYATTMLALARYNSIDE